MVLAISTFVEDYQWSVLAVTGISLTVVGNWLALRKTKRPLVPPKQQ